jgi:hypothetical protein
VPRDTLASLSAYLTLQRAKELYGFDPAKYGLTEAQAANVAGVFARFDSNDDGRIDLYELRALWCVVLSVWGRVGREFFLRGCFVCVLCFLRRRSLAFSLARNNAQTHTHTTNHHYQYNTARRSTSS